MRILSLDPSMTSTGFAYIDMRGLVGNPRDHKGWKASHALAPVDATLIDVGRITPTSAKGVTTAGRVDSIVDNLAALLLAMKPEAAVVEVPSSHVNPRRHGGGGAGLAIYGWVVGAVRHMLVFQARLAVCEVAPDAWTRGPWQRPADRGKVVAAHFPNYDPAADPGGDARDAAAVALWATKHGRLPVISPGTTGGVTGRCGARGARFLG